MQALTELTTALQALPASTNPWPVLVQQIREAALPTTPAYFESVINLCHAVSALGIIASLATLTVKFLNGGAWIWQSRTTPRGTLKAPNVSFLISLFCFLSFIAAEIDLLFLKRGYVDGGDTGPSIIGQIVPWNVVISITWLQIWTMTTALYLHNSSRHAYARDRQLFHPILITIAALSFFPILYGVTTALFSIAGINMTDAYGSFATFKDAVAPFTSSWAPGNAFAIIGTEPFVLPLMTYVQKMEGVFDDIVISYKAYTTFLLFSVAIFLPTAVVYGKMLRAQIQGVERNVNHNKASSMADFKSIKRAYHLLVLEALVITSLGLLYSAESLWVVIDPNGAMRSGENIAVIYTLAFLTSTLAELLVCLILLYKTVRPLYRKSTGQTQTLTEGIMIETEVVVHIDADENRNPLVFSLAQYNKKPDARAFPRSVQPFETAVVMLDSDSGEKKSML